MDEEDDVSHVEGTTVSTRHQSQYYYLMSCGDCRISYETSIQ